MYVYRISRWRHLHDLSGTGAKLFGGRWNPEGTPLLYCASTLSLAVLELLANQENRFEQQHYGFVKLEIPEDSFEHVTQDQLPDGWRSSPYIPETQQIGEHWVKKNSTLALSVPSAVLSQENNILVNPAHPDFHKVKIITEGQLQIDGRVT